MRKALAAIAATLLVAAVICAAAYPASAGADTWPKKYTGVGLKADSNEVAVEGIS